MPIDPNLYGHIATCQKCGRHILLEEKFNGVSHTMAQIVCHWECLSPEQQATAVAHYKISVPEVEE